MIPVPATPRGDPPFLTAINARKRRLGEAARAEDLIQKRRTGVMEQTWVVVAESSRARIFSLRGYLTPMEELKDFVNPAARTPEHDLISDRPGRTTDSTGGQRHAKEPQVSPKEQVVLSFAREVADHLEQGRARGDFERLIVAAAPEFLGLLRRSLSDATRQKIKREIHKNIVREDEQTIRGYLQP
jgi:protein required for attachment to host cells